MGKLVPQNPSDESASVLLEKIAEEKAQLIADKKIKKQKALPEITDEEKPFELPNGWEYSRFGYYSNEIATGPFGSMIHKRDYIDNGVPLINPSHMINSAIQEDIAISVSKGKAKDLASYTLYEHDIVMARRGEMGRCALVTKREEKWLCGTGSFVLRFNKALSRTYILLLFKTQYVKNYLGGMSIGTTMTNLNHGILNKMPLLIPPLPEQYRIVARVDELMILCEQLKARLSVAQTTQLHLADAVVSNALSAPALNE
jgi:type I restriction enzyme S subunit